MLNKASIGSATVLISDLISRGKTLQPLQGSPLAELAFQSTPLLPAGYRCGNELDVESLCLDAIETSNSFNAKIQQSSEHDLYLDRTVSIGVSIIQRNLDLVRNTVQPMVRDVVESVERSLADYNDVTFRTPIVTDKVLSIFTQGHVRESIKVYAEGGFYEDLPFINEFSNLGLEEVAALLPSMNSRIDEELNGLLELIGAARVIDIYTKVFVTGMIDSDELNRNELLLVFLMSMNLADNRPDAFPLTDGSPLLLKVMKLRTQLAIRLNNSLTKWEEAYKLNRLVISYPARISASKAAQSDPIVVHDELYEEWLAAGGTPDLIYGAFFADRPTDGQLILKERTKYDWEAKNYLNTIASANQSNRLNLIKQSIRETLFGLVRADLTSAEPKFNLTHMDAIDDYTKRATNIELDDTLGFVTMLVCEVFYPETMAKKLIDNINYHQRQHPETRVEDLATLAILDVLIEWIVDMMEIRPIGA